MHNPVGTYRLQFNKDFTFKHLKRIIPYLKRLGVSTVYASPIFEATPGSTHGYDVVNPLSINPEIGTLEELESISQILKKNNISWLQDIVPNHMAFHQNNLWLMDVLEKGQRSEFAEFFDIIWSAPVYNGRLMVPFLGLSFEEALNEGQIKITFRDNQFLFTYADQNYPLNLQAYITILQIVETNRPQVINQLIAEAQELHQANDNETYNIRFGELKQQLSSLQKQTLTKRYIQQCIDLVNDQPELLQIISDEQYYQLCHWQETEKQINYRRFFTVNGLICLNMHIPGVFDECHKFIKTLLDKGIIQGLRLDHIDGLYDPTSYLERLRELAGPETYIVVEKILEDGEHFPENWPVQGSTGYDFLAIVNNLFTQTESKKLFADFYKDIVTDQTSISQAILKKKSLILYQHMAGELENLYQLFHDLELTDNTKVNSADIKTIIAEFLIRCPVYRYYGNQEPLSQYEQQALQSIFKSIREAQPNLADVVELIENIFIQDNQSADYAKRSISFYMRCMQFTGPLMAKGVEDTLMYTYDRFIGHNEVGDTPKTFGLPAGQFHEHMQNRQQQWPLAMNTTATHDTKRGEGTRARLNVLTDIATKWISTVKHWQKINGKHKTNGVPDANDEYLIYQTIISSYPMPGEKDDFHQRMEDYLIKGLREAKLHTQWAEPNEAYEESCKKFVNALLKPQSDFMKNFKQLQPTVADHGIINALSQTLLKFTCPGIPDVYQGTEFFDLSMVDPDNRRLVDYDTRANNLDTLLSSNINSIAPLWADRYNANIKLWLTQLLFNERKTNAETFEKGNYIPLTVKGKYKDHVLAYARCYRRNWYIVAIPLHLAQINTDSDKPNAIDWGNTRIILPDDAPLKWNNLLSGAKSADMEHISVSYIFKDFPLALLKSSAEDNERGAGILMHITSLPSAFGIGDMGPEARKFVDFLYRNRQKYWQMLPFNPVEEANGYSPYSSRSSMAANVLFISPEELVNDGLLRAEELEKHKLIHDQRADHKEAIAIRKIVLGTAYRRFQESSVEDLKTPFTHFKQQEAFWLDDFAIYEVIKTDQNGKPWYQWPEAYKNRESNTLQTFIDKKATDLDNIKWQQWLFSKQWKALKTYANNYGIKLYGDIPFYVSYDSVDVWANPQIFKLDDNGQMTSVAGVPPDYFNANGQLWGMPIFNWDALKASGYQWWLNRMRRNMEYFDLLRLDHFRAFSKYWEVAAGETTAINGSWQPGPGADFFKTVKTELGSLPFVAEDLGEITPDVYQLRDQFNLPGMRVLQFAFGDDMPASVHIPYNHIPNAVAYTGTHDNNTIQGWYSHDASKEDRKRLKTYIGGKVKAKHIHEKLAELCFNSVAAIAIIPIQDILGLDETNRMNIPSSTDGNWNWRLPPDAITFEIEKWLLKQMKLFNRL
ncbi:MAG: malto-oligosyltrehalose synthase [Mucilaginibacter sp.]|uniref:malto-oligosyltrehalose synthase n=1 Tax=Mucilaginibacter sp. TaxID=1882438 RepID=UPI0031A397F0